MAVRNRKMSELSRNLQNRTVYLTSYLIHHITETEHVIMCVCVCVSININEPIAQKNFGDTLPYLVSV